MTKSDITSIAMVEITVGGEKMPVANFEIDIERDLAANDDFNLELPIQPFNLTVKTEPEILLKALGFERKLVIEMPSHKHTAAWRLFNPGHKLQYGGVEWRLLRRDWKRNRVHFCEVPQEEGAIGNERK